MGLGKRNQRDGSRFGRSGHTSHAPRTDSDQAAPADPRRTPPPPSERYEDPRPAAPQWPAHEQPTYHLPPQDQRAYQAPRYDGSVHGNSRPDDDGYDAPRYDDRRNDQPRYDQPRYDQPRYDDRRYAEPPSRDEPGYRDPHPDPRGWDDHGAHETQRVPRQSPGAPYPPGPDRPTRYLHPDEPGPAGRNATREFPGGAGPSAGSRTGAAAGAQAAAGAGATSPAPAPKITVTRAVALRGKQTAQTVTRKVVAASQADGAKESGLTPLIWNQVLSFGSDAMITVALAGTVFFGAAQGEQKGNVLGYLLITMAPFAIVAPVIGPALDRLQHGRRWAMAAASFGRAILAVLMAQNFDNLLVLFPLALGSLVLSKAYSVVRAAAAPRVVPADMTLVSANARLSIFGLGAAIVGGSFIAAVIKLTQSYSFGLWLTAVAFGVTGYFSLCLPPQVDSANSSSRHPGEPPRPARMSKVPPIRWIRDWMSRGFDAQVIIAMQGASVLRWASGFLTLFLAFYIERTSHGFDAALALGSIAAGVGLGNFLGVASGARFKFARPEVLVVVCAAACAGTCIFATFTFSLLTSAICMAVTGGTNSLGKLALDSVVQRDVSETLRSSAFARSETFLQLAWVFGATTALLLPSNQGRLGLGVASAFLGATTLLIVLRSRAIGRSTQPGQQQAPGTV